MKARLIRPLLNFAASVAMVSGGLLLVEAAVTVVWQEPLTSLVASRAQANLSNEVEGLAEAARLDRKTLDRVYRSPREIARELAERQRSRLDTGDPLGKIEMPTIDASYVMVEGSGTAPLRKGPGHYSDTPLPGMRGTFAVAGHRTTYAAPFRRIDELANGDAIEVEMPYGRFTYEVENKLVVEPDDTWVKDPVNRDRLILTACHPVYSAKQRFIVFADLKGFKLTKGGDA
ncbi:MAG: class E sortase [Actinomycetota bacterium]|nr:class E sortase [Actinomycetota bacterium]